MHTIAKWLRTKLKESTGTPIIAVALLMASATVHAELVRLTITGNIYGVADHGRLLESVLGSVPGVGGNVTASWLVDTAFAAPSNYISGFGSSGSAFLDRPIRHWRKHERGHRMRTDH
jgi:hypothetical protein